jgi:hypothetical protein
MNQGDKIFNLTYSINYALSNSHHSIEFKNNDYMHIPELFDEVIRYYKPRKNQVESLPEEWKNGIEIGYYEEKILKPPLIIMRDNTEEELRKLNTQIEELKYVLS